MIQPKQIQSYGDQQSKFIFKNRCLFSMYPGVVTIAGGTLSRGGGHVDGPSEDAKFSNDFDVVYVGSTCSLLVVDRGNQAIREIQLNDDECSQKYDGDLNLGTHKINIHILLYNIHMKLNVKF